MKLFLLIIFLLSFNLYGQNNRLEKVSLQLQWKDQFQFAGYYMAKEKGFYSDVGLDVELKKFKFGIDISSEVVDNKTDFGTGRISLIQDRSKGKEVVLLSAIFQSSPLVLASKKSSAISDLKDLKDKRISLNSSDNGPFVFSLLASENISQNNIKHIATTDKIKSLINDEIDIGSFYTSNQIYILKKMGVELNIFDPSDYGYDFYSDFLFTSEYMINNYPKKVNNFKDASLKGWEYAFENIEETVNLIIKKYNTTNKSKEELLYEAKILKKLAYKNTDQIGKIDKYRIQSIHNLHKIINNSQDKLDIDKFIYTTSLELSSKEKEYLSKKEHINMCIDPNWMPFEKIDENGNHIGMTSDYYNIFQDKLNTNIKLIKTKTWSESLENVKNRKCDILSLAMETSERKKYLNFTTAYLKTPIVIATKFDVPFIENIESIKNKNVGIPKGYAFVEVLKNKYNNLNIIEVKNIDEGLAKVNKGELFGYIGGLATISHQFQKGLRGELKIAGKFNEPWELAIGVRNDDKVLFSILNKLIENLDSQKQQEILNKWVSIKYEKGTDYTLAIIISIFFIIIIISIVLSNITLKKEILKRKDAEESLLSISNRLDDFVKLSTDFIWEIDKNGMYTYASEGVESILGYKVSEVIGKSPFDFIDPNEKKKVVSIFTNVIKNHLIIDGLENWNITKDGQRICLLTNGIPLIDSNGELIGYRGSDEDITKNKEQEHLLFEQTKLASMGEMIGNIAHQWRQPLSVISTGATGMQMQKEMDLLSDEAFNNTCNSINKNAQYLSRTIDDFKNFIKGDMTKKSFNLRDNIHSFLQLVNSSIKNNDISIILDLKDDITVHGYANELIQCLINIFNNSKDALKDSKIEKKFIFISTSEINNQVSIKIKDNAGGIPIETISKIFEPYFTTKHKEQGTGIGLSMSYNLIVDGMNGNIEANNVNYTYNNQEYKGVEMIITIPL